MEKSPVLKELNKRDVDGFAHVLSLVRIEASYGPIYLVVRIALSPDDEGADPLKTVQFLIEMGAPPEGILANTVAVIRGGLARPANQLTHVRSVFIDPDFESDVLKLSRRFWTDVIFPEAEQ